MTTEWKLVPVDLPDAMLKAAFAEMNRTPGGAWKAMKASGAPPRALFDAKMRPRWAALLAAAPPPPVAEDVEGLAKENADLTKALTGLTCGGSEFFIRKGKRYVADIPACVEWVRRRDTKAGERIIKLTTERQAVEAERDELQRTFEIRWEADQRAIKAWQAATGRDDVWPDRADMVVFLLGERDALREQVGALREALNKVRDWDSLCDSLPHALAMEVGATLNQREGE